jgi:predicted aspartyl protease
VGLHGALPRRQLANRRDLIAAARSCTTATGVAVERTVGYAVLEAEGHETVDEVVFAEPGDLSLLGVRTLEGFGVVVDPLGHRLVAVSTIAAGSQEGT